MTKEYLAARGIAGSRIKTISYGKERPVAVCNDISCWSQNRRAVTVLNATSNPPADTRLATLPPSASPQDEYDMAYGYILHKDYALAEQAFRDFLKKYPNERLLPDAQYWLGESLYQRQRYRDAVLPRGLDQIRSSRQGAGFIAAPRPVAGGDEPEGSRLRHLERGRPQISESLRQREARRRAGNQACEMLSRGA